MALTPRKKIVAAIIALSAVFAGVSLVPALIDNDNGNNNNNATPDVTAPALPAPPRQAAPQPAPVDTPQPATPAPATPAPESAAPVRDLTPAPDEPAAVIALRTLRPEAASADPAVRLAAARQLDAIALAHPRLSGHIMPMAGKLLKDNDPDVRAAALGLMKSIGMAPSANGVAAVNLIGMLAANMDQPASLRAAAAAYLGDIAAVQKNHAPAAVQMLVNITADADNNVRQNAIRALGRIGTAYNRDHGYNAANNIGTYLNDNSPAVRNEARGWARKICDANPALNCPRIP